MSLHVFTNDFEWVVAESTGDARAIIQEVGTLSDGDFDDEGWHQEPDEADMRIWINDETGEVGEGCGCTLIVGAMAVWAEVFGRGYLCTSEF